MTALLDFLKKKEEIAKAKKVEKKTAKVLPVKKETKKELKPVSEKKEEVKTAKEEKVYKGKDTTFSYQAVRQPHISEKASYLADRNQYVFEVLPAFNKKEIKRSVEGVYKVNVLSVNLIKIPPKKRRLGKTEGFRKGYRKAIVKIKEGQKIEVL